MRRVQLIVMGLLEHKALASTLERAMLGVIASEPLFTNALPTVSAEPASRPPDVGRRSNLQMLRLADEVAKLLLGGGVAPVSADTMLLIVGDVELIYLDRSAALMDSFHEAMEEVLSRHGAPARQVLRAALQDRCSYHLFRPMVEASFFGDAAALHLAGVSRATLPRLKGDDVEEFESVDPLWLPECQKQNALHHAQRATWWRHERHAKHYLTHLASRPGGTGYNEGKKGAEALRTLHWPTVVNTQPSPYLRALFDDLADWLGVPNPLGPTDPTHPRPPTALCRDPGRLLRNIPATL